MLARGSANDRFKARWNTYVSRATVAAVAIHAALLAFGPSWKVNPLPIGTPADVIYLARAGWNLPSEPDIGAGPLNPVANYVPSENEDVDDGQLAIGAVGGGEGDATDVTEMLRQRLLGGPPLPTVTEPLPEPEPEDALEASMFDGEDGQPTTIDNEPTTTDFENLLEFSPLDLDRLSALQPEIALGGYSAWPLVRNPSEVMRFMTSTYAQRRVAPGATGTVSVTVWIDEHGSVGWAEISESSGREDMDELALMLFNEIVAFRPAQRGGVNVPISVTFWVSLPWLRGLLP
ncbi:MAG TPA: energy transducer TonB [Longimicrobiales bacterium]|nr:energy transducer TonB [Longimicrobiales bacterium]